MTSRLLSEVTVGVAPQAVISLSGCRVDGGADAPAAQCSCGVCIACVIAELEAE